MSATEERTWTYQGETLTVDGSGFWHIKGDNEWSTWMAYASACAEVDKRHKHAAAVKKEPLDLPALTDLGEAVRITGINRASSRFITVPASDSPLYADTPQVLALLRRKVELEQKLGLAQQALFELSIEGLMRYGRIDVEDYAEYVAKAKASHAAAMLAAKKLEQP